MLVVFLGYNILILVSWKVLCRNEILIFLGSAHFPCQVKMRSFQKIFSKNLYLLGYCASNLGTLQGFKIKLSMSILLGFSKNVSDEHTCITSTLKVPPGILAFTSGKSLRKFRKDNNLFGEIECILNFCK